MNANSLRHYPSIFERTKWRGGEMDLSFSRNQRLKLKNAVLMVIFKSSFGAYGFSKGY